MNARFGKVQRARICSDVSNEENFVNFNKTKIKLFRLLINHHFIQINGTLQVDLHAFLNLAAR